MSLFNIDVSGLGSVRSNSDGTVVGVGGLYGRPTAALPRLCSSDVSLALRGLPRPKPLPTPGSLGKFINANVLGATVLLMIGETVLFCVAWGTRLSTTGGAGILSLGTSSSSEKSSSRGSTWS